MKKKEGEVHPQNPIKHNEKKDMKRGKVIGIFPDLYDFGSL